MWQAASATLAAALWCIMSAAADQQHKVQRKGPTVILTVLIDVRGSERAALGTKLTQTPRPPTLVSAALQAIMLV